MKNLNNNLTLTAIITIFSASLLASSITSAQPNWGMPFTPMPPQMPNFPQTPQPFQNYVNPFSTPNMPHQQPPRFRVPMQQMQQMNNQRMVPRSMMMPPQQVRQNAPQRYYPRPTQYPNRPMGNNFPSNFGMGNNTMPFAFPNSFPAMPFGNNNSSNPMKGWNKGWGNMGNNIPFIPQGTNNNGKTNKKTKKAWGDKRYIWPDFYTNFTDEAWDEMMGGPRKLGRMPGGWRFPYISTPDPVTVSDAITNQFPPIAEEAGNMVDISKWGVFDGK
ncbi:MAG: hypothetical protein KAG28_08525 [Cocleimonas sp.]|nr:hypothetical protein [Cocleimonas sp.]